MCNIIGQHEHIFSTQYIQRSNKTSNKLFIPAVDGVAAVGTVTKTENRDSRNTSPSLLARLLRSIMAYHVISIMVHIIV